MFYACQIHNNLLGSMEECESIEDAVALVKKIVGENGVELTPDVEAEINNDWSYLGEDWSVCIGKP
jgi:hypothetical protein